jgi:hypothetical protein
MMLFASIRLIDRSAAFTGPIEAGRIDSVLTPRAAKATASSGRPASSPQNDSGVAVSVQRSTMR